MSLFRFMTVLLVFLGFFVKPVAADSPGTDIMVVLDLSGSMKSRGGANRYTSLFEWLVSHTDDTDRIGVVAMGYGARLIAPPTPKVEFEFESFKSELKDREKFTDVAAGLESAFYQLSTLESTKRKKVILLYSDAEIDMPGGEWDERDAKRYLIERLNPAMKAKQIRFIAVVPDGLKANFQLLHELSSNTGGMYFRGIPEDGAALQMQNKPVPTSPSVEKATALSVEKATAPSVEKATAPSVKKPIPPETQQKAHATPPRVVPLTSTTKPKVSLPKSVPAPQAQTPKWIAIFFVLFGISVLGMFGIVLYLIKKQRQHPSEIEELNQVLNDVHSLKQMTSHRRISSMAAPAFDIADTTEDEELDSEEIRDPLSVSMVTPFLDYPDSITDETTNITDISMSNEAAFSNDTNVTISNMETLLGTAPATSEEQNSN